MFKDTSREKLINAILFFASNTKHCGKVKLFKLLYLLDFEHFKMTGRSVTDLDYFAWKMGPVPAKLYQEWDCPESDFSDAIAIEPERIIDHVRGTVRPKVEFNPDNFTKRELKIMGALAQEYCDENANEMVDVTHMENEAWHKVWNRGAGFNAYIPYELALSETSPNRDAIIEAAQEHLAFRASSKALAA